MSVAAAPDEVEKKRMELARGRADVFEAAERERRPRKGRKEREGSDGWEEERMSGRSRKWECPWPRRRDSIWSRI